jgi:hypothetical protein
MSKIGSMTGGELIAHLRETVRQWSAVWALLDEPTRKRVYERTSMASNIDCLNDWLPSEFAEKED